MGRPERRAVPLPPRAGPRARRATCCGRRLYETMLVWETDPSLRDNEDTDAFADVWCALPKVVFSRTLDSVQGNARLAEASLADEVAAALAATDKDVEIGGAGLRLGRRSSSASSTSCASSATRSSSAAARRSCRRSPRHVPLELVETRTFGSRVIYERYRRARNEPGPQAVAAGPAAVASATGSMSRAAASAARVKNAGVAIRPVSILRSVLRRVRTGRRCARRCRRSGPRSRLRRRRRCRPARGSR